MRPSGQVYDKQLIMDLNLNVTKSITCHLVDVATKVLVVTLETTISRWRIFSNIAFHRKLKVRIEKIQNISFGLFIWGTLSIRKEYTFVRQESIMLLVQYVEYRVSMVVGHEFIVVYEKSFAFLPGVTINLNKTVLKAATTAAIAFYL